MLKAKGSAAAESKPKEFQTAVFCLCEQFKDLSAKAVNQINWKLQRWI